MSQQGFGLFISLITLSLEVGQTRSINITKGIHTNKTYGLMPVAVHLSLQVYHNLLHPSAKIRHLYLPN